jgi:hypothetical protein
MPLLNQNETPEEIARLAEPDPEFTEVCDHHYQS